jgi:hypothetical protein
MHSVGRPFNDIDGFELPDIEAAHAEAIGLARDLMRMKPEQQDWSRGRSSHLFAKPSMRSGLYTWLDSSQVRSRNWPDPVAFATCRSPDAAWFCRRWWSLHCGPVSQVLTPDI